MITIHSTETIAHKAAQDVSSMGSDDFYSEIWQCLNNDGRYTYFVCEKKDSNYIPSSAQRIYSYQNCVPTDCRPQVSNNNY